MTLADGDLDGERIGAIVRMIHRMPRLNVSERRPFVLSDTSEDTLLVRAIIHTDGSVGRRVFGVQTFEHDLLLVDSRQNIRRRGEVLRDEIVVFGWR